MKETGQAKIGHTQHTHMDTRPRGKDDGHREGCQESVSPTAHQDQATVVERPDDFDACNPSLPLAANVSPLCVCFPVISA